MSILFTPLTIKALELKNRLVMSPMAQYTATDGFTNDWHLVHYGTRATGGVGLIITEATSVVPEGRITPLDLGIWKDEHVSGLQQIVSYLHQQQTKAGIQLAHSGRKGSYSSPWQGNYQLSETEGGWQTVAPSAMPFDEKSRTPLALDKNGIRNIVDAFGKATERALQAGFDVVEIHAAHGYLLHEFLSPVSNHRTDEYGGTLKNRTRLLIEVVDKVRSVWPSSKPLFMRISATDWLEKGWDIEEAVELSAMLKAKDVDVIDASSGGLSPLQKIELKPGYQVTFSEQIRQQTGMMTGSVGLITSAEQAEAILLNKQADLVLLGRELLRNPYFPMQAAKTLNHEVSWPIQYARAK